MPGFRPGIHVFSSLSRAQDVDGRDKPGHDGRVVRLPGPLAGEGLLRRFFVPTRAAQISPQANCKSPYDLAAFYALTSPDSTYTNRALYDRR